jgi:hypothetical protein
LFFEKQGATLIVLQQQRVRSQRPTVESAALALAPIYKGVKLIMTYKQCLKPWVVARLLPNQKWVIIGRYHNPSDADGHLQLLLYSSS